MLDWKVGYCIVCFLVSISTYSVIQSMWLSFILFCLLLKLRPCSSYFFNNNDSGGLLVDIILTSFADFSKYWHEYEIMNRPLVEARNTLLVGYHSRSTLDLFYMVAVLRPKIIVSHMFFTVSLVGKIVRACGAMSSKGGISNICAEDEFINSLSNGDRPVVVLPGGLTEFGHSVAERYSVSWLSCPGFARIIKECPASLGTHTRVIPFYTVNCERIYLNCGSWHDFSGARVRSLMKEVRQGNIVQLPLLMLYALFSLGFFLLPMPVKLTTDFGKEIIYQPDESVESFASRVAEELNSLMVRSEERPPTLQKCGVGDIAIKMLVALYAIFQNIAITAVVLLLILLAVPISLVLRFAIWDSNGSRQSCLRRKVQ